MATAQISQENRLQVFANVFKGYMGAMPLVTAALAPLLTALNVIPTFDPQRKPLATMAGVLGFLLLAWLFYMRRTIALGSIKHGYRWFFNLAPLVLIAGSVICYVVYASALDDSIAEMLKENAGLTRTLALGKWTLDHPAPHSVLLQLLYLGMFLWAEAAFVMMAMREYANDVRHISEYEWMFGPQDGSDPGVDLPALPTNPLPAMPSVPALGGQIPSTPDPSAPVH
jgi:hypothetical protein